jgi:cytochrome c peroxidase
MRIAAVGLWMLILLGCNRYQEPTAYHYSFPSHFPAEIREPERNPATLEGIALGEMLFFDTRLSSNGKVACATCHQPAKAFSDGVAVSTAGVSGLALDRHAPSLFNLAWHDAFFWDGGAKDLESQTFAPLQHPDEMNADLKKVLAELSGLPEYKKAFRKAFGTDSITSVLLSRALAQYQRTIMSTHSLYDQVQMGQATFDELQLRGLAVFEAHCAVCHTPPLFTDLQYHNNGLDSEFPAEKEGIYQGRFRISYDSLELGAFKTPSLRNLAFTAPYMHDGRFSKLEEVLNHYAQGIKPSATLSRHIPVEGIPLSEEEKSALLRFLETLHDLPASKPSGK